MSLNSEPPIDSLSSQLSANPSTNPSTNSSTNPSTNPSTNGKNHRTDGNNQLNQLSTNGNVFTDNNSLKRSDIFLTADIADISNDSSEMPAHSLPNSDSRDCSDLDNGNNNTVNKTFLSLVNDDKEYSCGLCSIRPKWLQKFANKQTFLAIFCLTSVLQGMYFTYFVSVLTTIEKLYQIQSKTTGIIMSATEIGQIGGALLLTYYGGHGHRPKWIAGGMLVFAFASILCSTPHYLFGSDIGHSLKLSKLSSDHSLESIHMFKLSEYNSKLCSQSSHTSLNPTLLSSESTLHSNYSSLSKNTIESISKCDHKESINTKSRITNTVLSVFFVSLLFIGIGTTTVNTLGIPYIDDNVAPKESPLYFGMKSLLIFYSKLIDQ